MANFMGPMAPPQAAPSQPPQLDVRTNPGQRAQFKSFMQGMNRPAAPLTTAPIAPMLPAPTPSPMDQVDIFAPAQMADGGLADPFDRPSPKMVGGTTNLIDASGSNTGGGSSDPLDGTGFTQDDIDRFGRAINLGADLYDVNQSYNDPNRPLFGVSQLFAPGEAFGGMLPSAPSAPNMMQNAMQGIMDATQMQGPMGSTFSIDPVTRDGNLGIMANFTVPFEDGGPVRMVAGGLAGGTTNLRDASRPSREQREESFGDPFDRPSDAPQVFSTQDDGGDDRYTSDRIADNSEPVADALATIAAMDAAQENFVPGQVTTRERPLSEISGMDDLINRNQQTQQEVQNLLASMSDIDESAGDFATVSPVAAAFTPFVDPQTDLLFGEPTATPPKQDALSNFLDRNPPLYPRDDARPDMVMRQNPFVPDPLTDPYRGMGADDFDFGPAAPRTEDLVSNLLNRPVQYTTRGGNVIDRTVQQDLEARGIPSGLPGPLGKVADIFTTQRVGKYLDEIGGGAPGVIDAGTGQVVGYVGSGLMDGSQTFTGRAGYNPFSGAAQNVRFDPSVNAYIVTPGQPNQGEDAQQRNISPRVVAPQVVTEDAASSTPDDVVTPTPTPVATPGSVVVESTRTNVPVTVPNILPNQAVNPTFLPQSFLDLLASFNRPAPRAMQEGGAVLDQAAGNFLEALKVA